VDERFAGIDLARLLRVAEAQAEIERKRSNNSGEISELDSPWTRMLGLLRKLDAVLRSTDVQRLPASVRAEPEALAGETGYRRRKRSDV
jgi:hypothetical protein